MPSRIATKLFQPCARPPSGSARWRAPKFSSSSSAAAFEQERSAQLRTFGNEQPAQCLGQAQVGLAHALVALRHRMAEVRQVCTSGVVAGAGSQAGEQAGQRFVAIKRLQVMLEEVLGGDEAGEIVPAGEGFLALHQALQALVRLVGQQVEALRTQVLPSGFRGQGIHRGIPFEGRNALGRHSLPRINNDSQLYSLLNLNVTGKDADRLPLTRKDYSKYCIYIQYSSYFLGLPFIRSRHHPTRSRRRTRQWHSAECAARRT